MVLMSTSPLVHFMHLYLVFIPIGGRVNRASATETVDSGSIPSRVKPKTIKIGVLGFPA